MRESGRPRILVFGARGQVGWELMRTLAPLGDTQAFDRAEHDIADLDSLRSIVRSAAPTIIANAAAYTAVDKAQTERDVAMRVNAEVPGVLADEAKRAGALLVHFSTDYVFDGTGMRPYVEADPAAPLNVYGESKAAGDEAVLASGAEAYLFRVSWVFGTRGANFLRTMQRIAREQPELRVVADQRGSPTWSRMIAETVASAATQWLAARHEDRAPPPRGLYHATAPDHTSWHEFASAIVATMPESESWRRPPVQPIASREYPTPAARPAWSVLDSRKLLETFGIALPRWRIQLAACLDSENT